MKQLHFSFNCGTGPAFLVSPETYNDNQWHSVMFNRDRQNGTLVVDDVVVAEGSSPGNTQTINVDQPNYLGGISPEVLNNARHNFKVLSPLIKKLGVKNYFCFVQILIKGSRRRADWLPEKFPGKFPPGW